MTQLVPYDVIFFPIDGPFSVWTQHVFHSGLGRPPSIVKLMTSPTHYGPNPGPRVPHPDAHMVLIAEVTGHGAKPWTYLIVDALNGMTKKFRHPYIIFHPIIARDGMPFPINKCIRDIQGPRHKDHFAWRDDNFPPAMETFQ